MKLKDIIKDDKFKEFLGYEIEAYNKRPAPKIKVQQCDI